MYTSIVLVALTSSVAASAPVENLTWEKNYVQARQLGQTGKKPLAVIFGSGLKGFDKLSRDGQFNSEIQQALGDKYVCVYVDVSTDEGKKLASTFEVTSGTGVVLSNRSGDLQAFHHDGQLSNADLSKWLTRFADPSVVVRTTMTNASLQVSTYPTSYGSSASYNGYIQNGYSPGSYAPYSGFGQIMGGGGCPGGNCGGGFRR
jgi:hypothetical protein